jgi:hypothetical protein
LKLVAQTKDEKTKQVFWHFRQYRPIKSCPVFAVNSERWHKVLLNSRNPESFGPRRKIKQKNMIAAKANQGVEENAIR